MKENLTELVFIVDKSGSMSGLESDTIGGFNSTIKSQRKEKGEALVSTVFFNHNSEIVHDRKPLEEIELLTNKDYQAGGCTALLDAVGSSIEHIKSVHKYIRDEDLPEHTIFVIITDGYENSSVKYSLKEIKNMISKQKENCNWEFLFLGANIDAVDTAGSMGICPDNSVDFLADSEGFGAAYRSTDIAIRSARAGKFDKHWKRIAERDYKARK